MKLKLSNITINLPQEHSIEDRFNLVSEILEKYYSEFVTDEPMFEKKYGSRVDLHRHVKVKLDTLATYMLNSDKDSRKDKTVMSRYKVKNRPLQEMPFSQFKTEENFNGEHFLDVNGIFNDGKVVSPSCKVGVS